MSESTINKPVTLSLAIGGVIIALAGAVTLPAECNFGGSDDTGATDTDANGSSGEAGTTGDASTTFATSSESSSVTSDVSSTSSSSSEFSSGDTSSSSSSDAGEASTSSEGSSSDGDSGPDPTPTAARAPWACTNLGYARSWSGMSAGLTDAALWAQMDPQPSTGSNPLNSDLYPTTDDHGRLWIMTGNFAGAEPAAPGSWNVRWEGPEVGPRGNITVAAGTGCSATGTLADGFVLTSTNTDDSCYNEDRCGCSLSVTGQIRNLSIVKADEYVCDADLFTSYDGPGVCEDGSNRLNLADAYEQNPARWRFRPAFYTKLRPFKTIRFMMPGDINQDLGITSWADRTPVTALTSYFTGMPYEHQLDLANTLGADAWIHVPWTAEDADVWGQNIASLAATRLTDPSLRLILEWGNEPWNGGFRLHQQSNTILPRRYDGMVGEWPGGNQGAINVDAALKLTARETVRMCNAAHAALALPEDRISCAVNIQAGNINPDSYTYLGENGYNSGTPTLRLLAELSALDDNDHVDIISIAPYGNNLSFSATPTPESFLETWLAYLPSAALKMQYHANAIAFVNAQRAASAPARAPYTLAGYEYNTDHFTASGSGTSPTGTGSMTRSVMREVYHGDLQEVRDGVYSSMMTWPALPVGRPALGEVGPLCNFTLDTDSDGVWAFDAPQVPCAESAKCSSMLRAYADSITE